MRFHFTSRVFPLALCLLLPASAAQAGSIFSANSMGEIVHGGDAHLRAMGGTGLAMTEGLSGSLINPALLGGLKWAGVTASFRPEALYVQDESEKNVLTTVRAHNFALYLPLGKGLAVSLDLRQQTDSKFKIYQETTVLDKAYTKSVIGTGGTSLVSFSLARRFGDALYVGARIGHSFGKTTKSWKGDFHDNDYRDTSTSSKMENSGTRLDWGIALRLGRRFSAGAIFTPTHDVEQKEMRSGSFSPASSRIRTLTYPPTMGFGLAYRPNSKFRAEFDMTLTKWGDFEIDGQPAPNFTDVLRVAVGFENTLRNEEATSYINKVPLRLGYALEPWYLKTSQGEEICAHFLTMGIGLPFGRQGAHLDASLELGMRGDASSVGAEEKIVRGTISLWGFEPWFQRRK
jgi:hypothetical protein